MKTEEESRETMMGDREEIETAWRKEFDDLGESGVRYEFFKSAYLSDQRKEGFAYRWLGEKRKAEERTDKTRWRNIWIVLNILLVLVIAASVILNWFPGLIPFPFLER